MNRDSLYDKDRNKPLDTGDTKLVDNRESIYDMYDNEKTGAIDARSKDEIIFTGQVNSTVAKIADMLIAKNKAYGNSA